MFIRVSKLKAVNTNNVESLEAMYVVDTWQIIVKMNDGKEYQYYDSNRGYYGFCDKSQATKALMRLVKDITKEKIC